MENMRARNIEKSEKRLQPRFLIGLPVNLSIGGILEKAGVSKKVSGNLINISRSGACVSLSGPLEKHRRTSIHLRSLSDPSQTVDVLLQPIWKLAERDGRERHGLKFVGTSPKVTSALEEIIGSSQRGMDVTDLNNGELSARGRFLERIPHHATQDYTENFVAKRRRWLTQKTGIDFLSVAHSSIGSSEVKGNIENFIGVAQIPIGIFGPLKINGEYAKGIFYVPFATTEGGITTTYERGAIAITKAGGARTSIHSDENHLAPVFHFEGLDEGEKFVRWVNENFQKIKDLAESDTKHGKLLRVTPHTIGRRVVLDFAYHTSDAMGANLINVATEACCEFIAKMTGATDYFLRSNFTSEKKTSGAQLITNCGKAVTAEVIIQKEIVEKYLHTSPPKMSRGWYTWALASVNAGMLGFNAQYANGLAAIFIACGQDVAHITNGSVGMTMFEATREGDLYAAVKLPNLIVGTVGGGTALPTQRECLQIIGCYGGGNARKLAEIVGAALLAGEIAICAGITSKEFQKPHKLAHIYTRIKAYQQ